MVSKLWSRTASCYRWGLFEMIIPAAPRLAFYTAPGTSMSIHMFGLSWLDLLCLACIAWRGAESGVSSRVQPTFRGDPQGFTYL